MSLNNNDIQQLISILQRGLTTEDSDRAVQPPQKKRGRPAKKITKKPQTKKPKTSKTPKPTKTKSAKSAKSAKSVKSVKSVNKFDTMIEKTFHTEDTAIDKLLNKQAPGPRTREFQLSSVKCMRCGRQEEVHPVLLRNNEYRCNKCSALPGA